MSLTVGARVRWNDPDNGMCSADGVIKHIDSDSEIILVISDAGSEIECLEHELTAIT